jgi:hypothetical protein
MIEVRRDDEIHEEEGGWFEARWHFSFDHYRDSRRMHRPTSSVQR